jgi:hypothetical protein
MWVYLRHRPRKSLAFDNLAQDISRTLGHLFGVVEQRVVEVGGQNHSRSKNRARKTTSTSLIKTSLHTIDIHTISKHNYEKFCFRL